MKYVLIILFLVVIFILSIYYQSVASEHFAEVKVDEEYIDKLKNAKDILNKTNAEEIKVHSAADIEKIKKSLTDKDVKVITMKDIAKNSTIINKGNKLDLEARNNKLSELKKNLTQQKLPVILKQEPKGDEIADKFTQRKKIIDKLRSELKSSHEPTEKTIDDIIKESDISQKEDKNDVYRNTTYFKQKEGEYSGILQCLNECAGNCLEYGPTGNSWCFK